MTYLSKQIRDVLCTADLDRREVRGVPLSALYKMAALRLITPPWRGGDSTAEVNQKSKRSAIHVATANHVTVKLTPAGVRIAQRLQRAVPQDAQKR